VTTLGEALAADVDAGFATLVDATQDRVYALALSLTRSDADAQDVAQDAFVRAYRALRTYDARRIKSINYRPWLATIALNVWRNRLRGARREGGPLEREPAADPRDSPSARVERAESAARLRELLHELPERYRVAVAMRHVYGVPYAEAARSLGMPIGTLKANVHRGTRMLKAAFEKRMKEG
jgi:RNA polymerase sigma factor (sigma-70 family)